MDTMANLDDYRREIDGIDRQLLALFEQRMDVVLRVAEYKRENHMEVFQGAREKQVIDRAVSLVQNPAYRAAAASFVRHNMALSRALQKELLAGTEQPALLAGNGLVAYQGVAGSFSEEALLEYFGEGRQRKNYDEFEDVFRAIEAGEAEYGVVPIENSSTGGIAQVYDLLLQYHCFICGEQYVKVDQHLLALPGATLSGLRRVYSHAQGIAQSAEFLARHEYIQPIPMRNTAVSAKYVQESGDPRLGAIASARAAKLYGLAVLQECVNTEKDNTTRFVIVCKDRTPAPQADKVSVAFSLDDRVGTLYNLLHYFAEAHINMKKIESRPLKGHPFEYIFYVDFEGDMSGDTEQAALEKIREASSFFRVLGAYRNRLERRG